MTARKPPELLHPGHNIKIVMSENKWMAEVTIMLSRSEWAAPYFIEAPSQTALIELIRIILPRAK